ncbi:restriction endonuclease [Eudoraea adriatica]|uniref:restriction endonuclease n=1 Tax=Eudoraea adriatica TaxID=446681 RepID=UPI00035DCE1A|nr:restriction endonuclease [Eudoraea adriatica]
MKIYQHNELGNCDLIIDAIYEGGNRGNVTDDPINKILPVGNQGGFRYAGSLQKIKYIILYTSGENIDWPDKIDNETGVFQYYGDNKTPGHELHDTAKNGNIILKNLFESLHSHDKPRENIPPIFIFKKYPTKSSTRSVQFKGLCVPGTTNKNQLEDLVAIWKTSNDLRFQNYSAFFTILNISKVSRSWLNDLNSGITSSKDAPIAFVKWKKNGKYDALISQRTISIRTIEQQLPENPTEWKLLEYLFEYFSSEPTIFEYLAAEIYRMTDSKIIIDEVTRGTIDGGRDAIGRIKLGLNDDPIFAEFAIEAKCYNPGILNKKINTVGVKEVSRLISRIRNRQFGILVTTSAVSKQAYEEVRIDGHPIIFLSGKDIVKILIVKGINTVVILTKYLNDNYKKVSNKT